MLIIIRNDILYHQSQQKSVQLHFNHNKWRWLFPNQWFALKVALFKLCFYDKIQMRCISGDCVKGYELNLLLQHDPEQEIFASLLRKLISEPRSSPGSSNVARISAAFLILHQSQECSKRWCGSSCLARVSRGTAATIWKQRRKHRNQEQRREESC